MFVKYILGATQSHFSPSRWVKVGVNYGKGPQQCYAQGH